MASTAAPLSEHAAGHQERLVQEGTGHVGVHELAFNEFTVSHALDAELSIMRCCALTASRRHGVLLRFEYAESQTQMECSVSKLKNSKSIACRYCDYVELTEQAGPPEELFKVLQGLVDTLQKAKHSVFELEKEYMKQHAKRGREPTHLAAARSSVTRERWRLASRRRRKPARERTARTRTRTRVCGCWRKL